MKTAYTIFLSECLFLCAAILLGSCNSKEIREEETPAFTQRLPGDQAIYGLACDGFNDTTIVVLPEDNSDPVTYNTIDAKRNKRILGKLQIGDRLCVMLNKRDKTKADLVVNMDKLMGIWCYIVMPKMRYAENMSAKVQSKMMDQMSDSLKETYLIPREYGFYLKPDWVAQSVGYVDDNNALAEESPVVYPPLGYFIGWHMWNGMLVITSGTPKTNKNGNIDVVDQRTDTCSIDYLEGDSLVLSSDGVSRSYYRKENINDLNRQAQAIADRLKKNALKETVN